MAKDERMQLRIKEEDKKLIEAAAKINTDGNSSKFMIDASTAKAKRVLAKKKPTSSE